MNLIQYLAALDAVALAMAGAADVAQCNGRSALWVNPTLCTDAAKCSDTHILSAPSYAMYDVAWKQEEVEDTNSFAQCNGRSPLWLSPSLCTDSPAKKCTDSQILSAPSHDVFDVAWAEDDEQVESMLTNFMTWASLTRDMEMQKEELCDSDESIESMPWDIQMCSGDLKLVHRTQPMLGHGDYDFEPKNNPAMSGKESRTAGVKSRFGFGLPREKVRNFVNLLKPKPMHWRKIPAELYV